MPRRIQIISLFAVILFSGLLNADTHTVRILGVGNSFTTNAVKYLPQIIASNPEISADVGLAYIGGCSMDQHVSFAEAHEANPEKGNGYTYSINGKVVDKKASLKRMLLDGKWDYITIQQVSGKSYKIETYYPYTEKLIDYIRKYSPESTIVIHETWSHSIDSTRVKAWNLTPDDMYSKLHAAYGQIADEFQLEVIPVGTAFQNAKKRPLWDYKPTSIDTNSLIYSEGENQLPDESNSLQRIFSWRTNKEGKKFVHNDGYHAGPFGEYLGGLVWYEFFLQQDARKIDYIPDGFTLAQAVSLREVAHETMTQTPRLSSSIKACCSK
ncbi:DUF4886 domain-containing protein [Coraliomargarita sp. W4R53]